MSTEFTHNIALALPVAHLTTGNIVAAAMFEGMDNWSIRLSANGSEPATHYGINSVASAANTGILTGETAMPALPYAALGITEQAVTDMLAAIEHETSLNGSEKNNAVFFRLIARLGLQMVTAGA